MGKKDISKYAPKKEQTADIDSPELQNAENGNTPATQNSKGKKFPVVPVVAATAVVCAGAIAAVIMINANSNNKAVVSDESSGFVFTDANGDPVPDVSFPYIEGSNNALSNYSWPDPLTESNDPSVNGTGNNSDGTSIDVQKTEKSSKPSEPGSKENSKENSKESSKAGSKAETSKKEDVTFGNKVKVTVEGVDLTGKTIEEARAALEGKIKSLRTPVSIVVTCENQILNLSENDFVFTDNADEVIKEAYKLSRGEIKSTNFKQNIHNGVFDFVIDCKLDENNVSAAVSKIAEKFNEEPVNAHVASFNPTAKEKFTYADGKNGNTVNRSEAEKNLKEILKSEDKTGSFSLKKHLTKFTVTLADVKANTKLIGSHHTTAANVYNSNYNMELAVLAAGGTVVNPGETFSFNRMTGDTTNGYTHYYDNGVVGGYLQSTAIVGGQYVPEYGGGICQASTTIYIAAMKSGMTAIERHAHAYPSTYAERGLDATIDYGNLDMRFRNDLKYPVYIATYVYDYNGDGMDELMVEFYGPISTEYDEIVTVGWVDYAGSSSYSASAAQVYFKNGKEVKRVYLPSGSYDYKYDGYYYVTSLMPYDTDFGPSVSPTKQLPTIYSPVGCGSSAPIPYGTAEQYLKKIKEEENKPETSKPETSKPETSKPETSKPETSKPETSKPETSKPETSKPETSKPETSKPETSKPETSKPETSKPETSKPETSKPETSKPETSKPETSKPETSKPEASKPETSKPETSKPEASKPESSVQESSKPESSKPESSKPESSVTSELSDGESSAQLFETADVSSDASTSLPE